MGRETELFKAAQSGNLEFLERVFASYLASERSPKQPGRGRGKKQLSGVSLRKSASPNVQDEQGYTLLHHAALNGQCEAVRLLLRCGASTTIPDCSGSSPLHLAAWKGDLQIVKVLVSQGPSRANVNHQSDTDNTPLHLAAQYGYSTVVEYLLQRHADPMLHNCQGETPLDLAAQYGHLDTVHLLISHCPELLSLARGKFSPLHLAARNGHTLVALSLINAGIPVNVMGEHGTPLHEAALFGKPDTVTMLLDKGARTDVKDRASKSVLDTLREIPAEKAREITKMIEDHEEEATQSGVSSHVVAVATTSCTPASPASSALAYSAGDHITVEKRVSTELFEGSVNGKRGSFLGQDVVFQKEVGGRLVPVESPDDLFPPPLLTPSHPHNHTAPPISPSAAPPVVPPKSHDLRHRHSIHEPRLLDDGEQSPSNVRHQSIPAVPMKMKKLSKKEKRFQLSQDDGAYCALSVVDPLVAAQSDETGHLRLNPVGPAFVASLPGKPESAAVGGATVTSHNGPASFVAGETQNHDNENDCFLGSYYVLEVGNFKGERDDRRRTERDGEREGGTNEEIVPAAYYMLDMEHMTHDMQKQVLARTQSSCSEDCTRITGSYENVSAAKPGHYQNVELKKKASVGYENVAVKRCHERQKSTPLGIPQPSIGGGRGEGVVGQSETTEVIRRLSTSLPSHTTTGEMALERLTAAQNKMADSEEEDVIEKSKSHTEEMSSEVEGHIPRQRRNRDQVYEMTSVGFPKRRTSAGGVAVGGAKEASNDKKDKLSERGRAEVNGELDESGVATETSKDSSKIESTEVAVTTGESVAREETMPKSSSDKERDGEDEPLTKMIESNGVPFAGLVMSSSTPEEDPLTAAAAAEEEGELREKEKKIEMEEENVMEGGKGVKEKQQVDEGVKEKQQEGEEVVKEKQQEGEEGGKEKQQEGEEVVKEKQQEGEEVVKEKQQEGEEGGKEKQQEGEEVVKEKQQEGEEGGKEKQQEGKEGERDGGKKETEQEGRKEEEREEDKGGPLRPRTETIWDDCRVQREWNQIDSLLKDVRGSISTENLTLSPPDNSAPPTLQSWLGSNSMEKYIGNLETNGFDSVLFLGGGLLLADDLADIGITSIDDQLTLQATAHLLPPPPSLGGVASVQEWLESLHLGQLSGKFEGLSLRKISKMWDIELSSVVGVELLGHRRRLLYGISQLCHAHPNWSSPPREKWEGLKKEAPPTAKSKVLPSLFRDYTDIRPSPLRQTRSSPTSPIELRPPLESQGRGGANSRPHSLLSPSSSWRHSVASLVDETVSYEAKYLGSVIVVRVRGKQSTEEACLRLRTSTQSMQKLPNIILSVSWKGVRFIDGMTKMVVSTHAIQDISYCSQDIEDRRVFAYITRDKTGMYYCHVFMATNEVIAEEILMTVGQAFEIAYQKVQRARTKQSNSS